MAYNKDNYEEQRLTPKQEKFVDCILQGKSQRQAYITAYPRAKNWQDYSVDIAASNLMKNNKVLIRLKELGWKDKTKVLITRERMLKRFDKLMEENEKELERIKNAYEKDKVLIMNELSQWMQLLNNPNVDTQGVQAKINELTKQLIDLDKVRRLNSVNMNGIIKAGDRINRMMGFDITKVEITTQDEEREEAEKLDNEKLEVLASAILNNRKSNTDTTE